MAKALEGKSVKVGAPVAGPDVSATGVAAAVEAPKKKSQMMTCCVLSFILSPLNSY